MAAAAAASSASTPASSAASLASSPAAAAAALLLLLLLSLYLRRRRRPSSDLLMRRLVRLPVLGCVIPLFQNLHRLHDMVAHLLQSSSRLTLSVFIFGMEFHTTADPANVEHILKTNFRNYGKGYRFSSVMHDMIGDSIFNTDGDPWKFQRKLTVHGFSAHSLKSFIFPTVQTEIATRLLPVLYAAADSATTFLDLQDVFLRFAFDNVCQITAGVDPACLSPAMPHLPLVNAFDDASNLITRRFLLPDWLWRLKRALRLGSERPLSDALRVLHSFAIDVVRQRQAEFAAFAAGRAPAADNPHQRCDLLSRLMSIVQYGGEAEAESGKKSVEDVKDGARRQLAAAAVVAAAAGDEKLRRMAEECKTEKFFRDTIISFMVAGRDSSSVGLSWFFWLLMRHPEVEEKIYEEVRKVVEARAGGGAAAAEEEDPEMLRFEEVKEMQYLHAAIHEALRLYPPVPHDIKQVEEKDVLPDGTKVGRGSQVTYHPFAMARVASVWGPDCRKFRPERWLQAATPASDAKGGAAAPLGSFVQVSPFKFPVFQAGPRTCLGKDMALLLMKCIAAAVILRFRFAPADDTLKHRRPSYDIALTLKMTDGLPVRVLRRHPIPSSPSSSRQQPQQE